MARTTTLKGKPLELDGPELKAGDVAPDAVLKKNLVEDMRLSETRGKTRVFSVVPSLDTPVCAEQTRRFNKELADMPSVTCYVISCDLPMAMGRFCGAEGIETGRMVPLSDHKDVAFGKAYGTLIPDLRVECRAVFVVDAADKIRYAEYVSEVASHPNYEAVLACLKSL